MRALGGKMLLVATAAALIGLASCGGGGGASSKSFESARAIADALAAKGIPCTDFSSGEELYTRSNGTCSVTEDLTLDIATFAGKQQRDSWIDTAKSFGGVFVVGDTWALNVDDPDTAHRIADAIGGKVQ